MITHLVKLLPEQEGKGLTLWTRDAILTTVAEERAKKGNMEFWLRHKITQWKFDEDYLTITLNGPVGEFLVIDLPAGKKTYAYADVPTGDVEGFIEWEQNV